MQVELPFGKYLVREIKAHDFFLNDSEDNFLDVNDDGKVVSLEFMNTAVDLELDISKTGIIQAQPGDEIRYDFPSLINKSNVAVNDFTWEDHLPYDYVKITKLFTGTWNEDLDYKVYYKTNLSDYKQFGDTYNTLSNHFINFESLGLDNENEYITDFKVVFGTVKSGFTFLEVPFIFCKVDSDVKATDEWTNKTRLSGNYIDVNGNKIELTDEDEHTTISYGKKLEIKNYPKGKLPRTGNDTDVLSYIIRLTLLALLVVTFLYLSLKVYERWNKKHGDSKSIQKKRSK